MRQWLLLIFSIVAFCGAIVAAFATISARNTTLHGYVNPTSTTELPFRVPQFGVNRNLLTLNQDQLISELEQLNASNVYWIRQVADWAEIETNAGEFQWSEWDRITQAVSAYPDIQLIAVIRGIPQWAQADTGSVLVQNPIEFAQFAGQFASRYNEQIDYYQVWDGLDFQDNEAQESPTLTEYIAMLEPTYSAIHDADAWAFVLSAEFPPSADNKSNSRVNHAGNIREFYALGGGDFVDGIATTFFNFYHLPQYRDVMIDYGDSQKPIWLTSVSVDTQDAEDAIQNILNDLHEWAWLGGLILSEGAAVIDFANLDTAINGLYPAQNPYTSYSGIWNFDTQGADAGWVNDSQLTFDFVGSDVAVLVHEGNYSTYFYATIDNKPANALPQDSDGNAYLLLTSDTLQPETNSVTIATNLDKGSHQLRIVVNELIPDSDISTYPLIGFAISSGNQHRLFQQQINVAWITSLVAFISIIFSVAHLSNHANFNGIIFFTKWISYPFRFIFGFITSILLMIGMVLTWGNATPQIFRRDEIQLTIALISAGLIYLQPPFVFTILAGLTLFIIIYNHLEFGIMLTLFWSPFFLFPVELYRFAFPTAEIILFITATAWILQMVILWARNYQQRETMLPHLSFRHLHPLDYAVIAWMVLGILAFSWSTYRNVAITELRTIIIQPALYYMIFRTLPQDKKSRVVDMLIFAGVMVATIGLVQYALGESIIEAEGGANRLASVYGSPNNVSLFLGRCIPFALAFVLIPINRFRTYLSGFALGIMAIALILTQSVGALFIGIPITVSTMLILIYRRKALLPLIILGVIGVIGILFALQFPRFNNILDFTQGTNFYRLRVWDSGINIIKDHPITGLGLDQFLYAFRGIYILPDAWQEPNLSHPHNFLLDIWIRLGIFGVIWFTFTQFLFWRTLFRHLSTVNERDRIQIAIIIGAMGAMIDILAHGLVDNSLFVIDLAYVFMTLLAIATTSPNISAIDATT
ncbi:MAG: O-antigen ligase family protein [Aggregatilineales bacterium]